MPVKIIGGKKIQITFRKQKVKDYFMKICEKAPKVTVDWSKFRELDTNGLFSDFTNAQLSMRFRNIRLREEGLCYYCGEREATENNGTCEVCNVKVKQANSSYNRVGRKVLKNA